MFVAFLGVALRLSAASSPTPTFTPTATLTTTPDCSNAALRSWDFNTGTQAWFAGMNVAVTSTAGALSMTMTDYDPYVFGPAQLCLQPSERYVSFRLWNQSADTAVSIYVRPWGLGFSQTYHLDITVTASDSGYRDYWADLGLIPGWAGIHADQLRFDPGANLNSGTMLLDSLSISSSPFSPTPTPTATPSTTSTATPSITLSATPSVSPSPSPSFTPSRTLTPSVTVSFSPTTLPTLSASPSFTATPSMTLGPTATVSPEAGFGAFSGRPQGFVSPNPFFPGRPPLDQAHFHVGSSAGAGSLSILDLQLRVRRRIPFAAGQEPTWDGRDDGGNLLNSGSYLYLLNGDGQAPRKGSVTLAR